jgi:molecular chaperone GrpE
MDEKEKEKSVHVNVAGDKNKEKAPHEPETEDKKKKKKDEALEELKKTLEEKEKEIETCKEKILYQQADFENFKKLKAREKQDVLRFGNETLVKELLPVIDNLERAIEHAGKSEEARSITEGVALTLNGFVKVLEKFSVVRVDAIGKKFDPNLHEALYQEETQDAEPGTVVAEFQKGYTMDGRLLRPSMVSVAKRAESE